MKKIIVSLICLLLITLVTIGIFMGKGKDNSKDNLTKITVAPSICTSSLTRTALHPFFMR